MQTNTTRTGNPAFRIGLLFGILLSILSIVFYVIPRRAIPDLGLLISIVQLILVILAYLLAGKLASQKTGRLGTGALAGLWAALISVVITGMYTLVIFVTKGPMLTAAPPLPVLLLTDIFSIALSLLIGAGIGALGGLLRKR